MTRGRSVALALALAGMTAAGTATAAAQGPETGAFLTRLGTDTLYLERYTRTPTTLTIEQVVRAPRTSVRRYAVTYGPSGAATAFTYGAYRAGDDTAPIQGVVARFRGDSTMVTQHRPTGDTTTMIALPSGVIPLSGSVYSLYEQITRRARPSQVGDSVVVWTWSPAAQSATRQVVRRTGPDSVVIASPFGSVRARVNARGTLLGLYAAGTTVKVRVDRIKSADIPALAAVFAARDAAGHGLGTVSPRDTVRATVAGASLMVDYSRPAKRGRVLFGSDIVPWNVVWRTGADAATQFRVDKDLVIGGKTIPAGTYTLWTLPSPHGWQLIINRETGQWGTEYKPAFDLARVPATVGVLPRPVERFTIDIVRRSTGGVLELDWDTTRVTIPFTVK